MRYRSCGKKPRYVGITIEAGAHLRKRVLPHVQYNSKIVSEVEYPVSPYIFPYQSWTDHRPPHDDLDI